MKCTLSKPTAAAPADLKNIYLRLVDLKSGPHIAFTYRYATRDEVKNYPPELAEQQLAQLLGNAFLNADLFTTEGDSSLSFSKKGKATFTSKIASHTAPVDSRHDRAKKRLLDPAAPWLHRLGITNAAGTVLSASQDKWKQINKYLEIIDGLLRAHPLPPAARIADMGSGKGYLTFALYDFLHNHHGLQPQITGIELRENLVSFCNTVAAEAGFSGLRFVAEDIRKFQQGQRLDMLIALHACDTATDLALAAGLHAQAGIVVVAPCCHKQVRRALAAPKTLAPMLRHGILEERQAEILTDGIRALLLEAEGYKTQVFEFVSTAHTAKNVMITALREGKNQQDRAAALAQVAALKTAFGLRQHYLEQLL
ncbi:MAG: SAM-dependent methyltransferase [Saprospiraceae bacterium]|nr:SAM-dependent methyltransferase [Saprospiraceae bacterium]